MITAVRNGKYITRNVLHFKVIDTSIDDMDSVGSDIEDEVEDIDPQIEMIQMLNHKSWIPQLLGDRPVIGTHHGGLGKMNMFTQRLASFRVRRRCDVVVNYMYPLMTINYYYYYYYYYYCCYYGCGWNT